MVKVEQDSVSPAQAQLALGERIRAQDLVVLGFRDRITRQDALNLVHQEMGGFPLKPFDMLQCLAADLNRHPPVLFTMTIILVNVFLEA
ncbi:MAG: hypothetical protein ABSE73_07625 [Planctomycetota bacterium]